MSSTQPTDSVWIDLLWEIADSGSQVGPRGKGTLEILAKTTVVDMKMPVVTIPQRNLGYKFMAAEAHWILSGDNRVETIAPYSKQISRFSDDGVRFFGAYGPKVVDQLSYVVDCLVRDEASRQAVMTIWRERPGSTKDVPCLSGDTELWSPEGQFTLEELSEKFLTGEIDKFPVLSFDPVTRDCRFSWCTNVWKSGRKETIKITFDDGSSVRCTRDHRFYKKVRRKQEGGAPRTSTTFVEETEAGNLQVGDRLWANSLFRTGKKKRLAFLKNLSKNSSFDNHAMVHTEYAKFRFGCIPDGYDVHHVDNDVDNNSLDNLELIEHGAHSGLKVQGTLNPAHNETNEQRDKRRMSLRETWIKKGYNVKPIEEYENNHKIVSIESYGVEDVYDFTVPGDSNAIIGTGVVTHNCTVALQFMIRDGKLNCHATMRSSDAWLGWVYDVFNFSMVAWTVLEQLRMDQRYSNLQVGSLFLTAASQHLYDSDRDAYESLFESWRSGDWALTLAQYLENYSGVNQNVLQCLDTMRRVGVDEVLS